MTTETAITEMMIAAYAQRGVVFDGEVMILRGKHDQVSECVFEGDGPCADSEGFLQEGVVDGNRISPLGRRRSRSR